jgi:peroxiredoxin Q/BCP
MRLLGLSLLLVCLTLFNFARADVLTIDTPAPTFELNDQSGVSHTINDYAGKWIVLYFYPKNDTPGCTTQACAFRDEYKVISALNTQVLGVSIDNQDSHAAFAEKYSLPFPLLADTDGVVARSYGALASLGPIKFAKRHTIIISPEGLVKKVYRSVNVSRHSKNVIADLKAFRAEEEVI